MWNRDTTSPNKKPEQEKYGNIHHKDPEVWETIKCKVEGSKNHYYDGIQHTQNRGIKRYIAEECQIITIDLSQYPYLERWFNDYELRFLSRLTRLYYPTIFGDFFMNYFVIFDKYCPKGSNFVDMRNRTRILMREVILDSFEYRIN